ncbi:HTH-type transcriptional activator RhaR [Aquimixticola soesokkakensis]|uniref:HTH-type transcriptional activator RhaR n=1 Tax=Aquimixticola soesokkakensis TaxID=1519096 RepID=A0A1Y5TGD4_9RHOB|nr:AraC family transcriptional regulator [Aquimixticola soesokkakensis]SLN63474.1 HTH-type transcriptional activator RhaR [Aquimixticola soesokkakensis]
MITTEPEDYFVYLPENRLCAALGCTALSTGFTRILPGSEYPPVRHPDDHHLIWERGRTLQAYQFAFITEGRGRLQAAPKSEVVHEVNAGDVILLFPGVWHRFSPEQDTGWTESWIECRGAAFDHMRAMGLFSPQAPLWVGARNAVDIFQNIHQLSREDALGNQPALSAAGLALLAQFVQSRRPGDNERARLVDRARRKLSEVSGPQQGLGDMARDLGVSYSTLRRQFREHMGISLKQYQTEVRMRRACELLQYSDRSVKEIAGLLGYSSPFHFSEQFQRAMAQAPSHWRAAQLAASQGSGQDEDSEN